MSRLDFAVVAFNTLMLGFTLGRIIEGARGPLLVTALVLHTAVLAYAAGSRRQRPSVGESE